VTIGSMAMGEKNALSIGDLSKATGTKVETIRWYEKVGYPARATADRRELSRLQSRPS
jgi:DNA-binding transcriptional MerR regulator